MTAVAICPFCGESIELRVRKDFESFTGEETVEHIKAEHPESVTDGGDVPLPYIKIEID
jgi:hypothetical protein